MSFYTNKSKKINKLNKSLKKNNIHQLKRLVSDIYQYEPSLYFKIKKLVFYPFKLHRPQAIDFNKMKEDYDNEVDFLENREIICPLCNLKTYTRFEDLEEYGIYDELDEYYSLTSKCDYCQWYLKIYTECQKNNYWKILDFEKRNIIYNWLTNDYNYEKFLWDIYCVIWQIIKRKYQLYKFMNENIPDMQNRLLYLSLKKKKIYHADEENIFSVRGRLVEFNFYTSFIHNNYVSIQLFSNTYHIYYHIPEIEILHQINPSLPSSKIKVIEKSNTGLNEFEVHI